VLNRRTAAHDRLCSPEIWRLGNRPVDFTALKSGIPIVAGLDLSKSTDLTSCVWMGKVGDDWHVGTMCWLPQDGLERRAIVDRIPYDQYVRDGILELTPGKTVAYEYVAHWLKHTLFAQYNVVKLGFDRAYFNFSGRGWSRLASPRRSSMSTSNRSVKGSTRWRRRCEILSRCSSRVNSCMAGTTS
jgi:phage terminase large subunit-like protein